MSFRYPLLAFCIFLMNAGLDAQALLHHHYSPEADIGHPDCPDTLHILSFRKGYEIGIILPSWQTVVGQDYVAVAEGMVHYNRSNGLEGSHVSHDDLPFYHYTHDMCFDIEPDATPDGRYTNLLPYLVTIHPDGTRDTALQDALGVEWECGLGAGNLINPCRKLNNAGKSCGQCSAGHERGDIIWQWPTTGDWVHVEGLYVWDRGHPPANCEIHPARLLATRRALPDKIKAPDGTEKFATRMDIYANGDGGAVNNNRPDAKPFVKPVKMSSKDYQFSYKVILSKPSPRAVLRTIVEKHKGDTYPGDETVATGPDGIVTVSIPWQSKNISDREVYGRTIYAWWDEGTGTSDTIDTYQVNLDNIYLKKLSEMGDRAEIRLFANIGNDWIFLNDFHGSAGKILTRGLGKTFRKHWALDNEFTLYVPRAKAFRVFMAGWEADGVDFLMGGLSDPGLDCNRKTKLFFKTRLFSIKNMLLRGCLDDEMGQMSALHRYPVGADPTAFTISPQEGMNNDPCPFSTYPLKNRYFFTYTVKLLRDK